MSASKLIILPNFSCSLRLETNAISDVSDIDGIDSVPPGVKSHILSVTRKKKEENAG